jgi:rhodanese-related sulfurtransferase
MCGRNISKETSSTIGEQRKFNYALQPMSRLDFVRMMTTDLPEAPAYFAKDAAINRTGAQALSQVPRPAPLDPAAFSRAAESGQLVLDVRPAAAFGAGHVPGALNIGLGGQFASWAGSLIRMGTPILLVAEGEAQVDEAVMRLARVGIESAGGYLAGGMAAWDKDGRPIARLPQMAIDELKHRVAEDRRLQILDVRRPGEYQGGHAPGAKNVPLSALAAELARLDRGRPTAIICQSGYRSSAAASLLAREGFQDLVNVVGGTSAWIQAGYPVEQADSAPAPA